jgi:RecA-superfamily ATPases implicated in signal transduction
MQDGSGPQIGTRISTGNPGLDDILGGGLDPDRLYLYEGRPGAGKTTLALEFLLEGARRGERVLYITLSESQRELQLVAERHGWDLSGVEVIEMAPSEAMLEQEQEITLLHPAEVELGQTTRLILDRVEQVNPTGGHRQPVRTAPARAELAALSPPGAGAQAVLRQPQLHRGAAG